MKLVSVSMTALILSCTTAQTNAGSPAPPLMIERQGSFFVGGTVRHVGPLSGDGSVPDVARAGSITTGQLYVQYQVPVGAKHLPVVMVHGGGLSGQAYETTPDGRMGWGEYFLRAGRPVYLVDQAGRGRSGFDATSYNSVKLGKISSKAQASIDVIGHEYAWLLFRIGPREGIPFSDSQFPLDAVDAFYKMWIPDLSETLPRPNPSVSGLAALGQQLGGAIILGHSQSFMFPERAALLNPGAVKGIISLESGYACSSQFTQQEQASLAKIPILIVFADHLSDAAAPFASRWSTSLTQCHQFMEAIRERGGDATLIHLPEIGIHGNTHMFMLDKNNVQIADLLLKWIDDHVEMPSN
jgi:pimeloyl-ACP methyl ester carboxylesterase